ncbi:MAG: TIGR02099 family protein [Betaproteobacteria bacterium]|nr:TIGR02099 family protein [Betaproteobacteria bacterium]NBP09937.1 TIGR02099 family protein [Betaproteobacteria bacterium]NDC69803.1 TIGR02099 family protein [Betaproteobacteria bacterium]NDG12843.1 TIGR02099 family protein [Betaproteobacteria bacterium]
MLRWLLGLALALGLLMALAYLGLRWYVWPQLHELGPRLVALINKELPRPLQLQSMRGAIVAGRPVVRMEGLGLRDAQGQSALEIGVLEAEISMAALLWGALDVNRLRLQDVTVAARRLNAQTLEIAGWTIALDRSQDDRWLQWLLSQSDLEINNLALRWRDDVLASEVLIEGVKLQAVNQLREHRWRVDAQRVGGALTQASLVAHFHHGLLKKPQQWRSWQGSLFFAAQRLDLKEAIPWVDAQWLPSLLPQGGSLQLSTWTDFSLGQIRKMQARLSGQDLLLNTPTGQLGLARVQTAFTAMPRYAAANVAKTSVNIAKTSANVAQASAPGSAQIPVDPDFQALELRLSEWSVDDGRGSQLRGTASAQRLVIGADGRLLEGKLALEPFDVANALALARRLPLPADLLKSVESLRAQGQVRRLSLHFEDRVALGLGSGSRYGASLAVDRLAVDVRPRDALGSQWPSFEGLSGELQIDESGGRMQLAGESASLRFPGLFEEPDFAVQSASAKLRWRYGERPDAVRIEVDALEFANADGKAQVKGHYQTGGKGAGIFDLKGQLSEVRAERVVRYLPLVVSQDLRRWLKSSVHGGTVSKADFVLRGDIEDFPFSNPGSGQFLVEGQLAGSRLVYAKAWPAIDEVVGKLRFEAARMQIDMRSAKVMGLALSETRATIADLDAPLLRISGIAKGQAHDMIRFVNASPIAAKINQFSQAMQAQGEADLELALNLPLEDLDRSQVLGTVQLQGNQLRVAPSIPVMSAVQGKFSFTEKALTLSGMQAEFLGGRVFFDGQSDDHGILRLQVRGRANAQGLQSLVEHPVMRALDGHLDYRAQVSLEGEAVDLRLESDGLGLSSRLPAPLNKEATHAWPLRLAIVPGQRFGGDAASQSLRRDDQIRLQLREDTQIWFGRERARPDAPLRLVSGVMAIDSDPLLPRRGLAISAKLDELSLAPWIALLRGDATESAGPLLPERLAISTRVLRFNDRDLHDAVLGASFDQGHWRLNLESREAAGFASWRVDSGDDPGEVLARFRRVHWPQQEPELAQGIRNLDLLAQRLPAMDIQIDSLRIGDRDLGASVIKASSRRRDDSWIWSLDALQMQIQGARLLASGQWTSQRMQLDVDLAIENAGQALGKLGFPDTFRGGEGRLGGRLAWRGLPWDPQYPSLEGRLELALGRGRFLRTEPGVAKLLSVFNLQSLPRRLSLDFSDIFSSGYSFDGLRATATIREGIAYTEDFSMVGLQAVVGLRGRVDLSRETQAMEAQVVPNLDAGVAAVAYGALINPFVGLGSLVAQYALAEPLKRLLTYRYAISGSWEDPLVVEIGREGLVDLLRKTPPNLQTKPKDKPG